MGHKHERMDEDGRELPDAESLAPPIGFIKQPPLHELIRQMVRSETLRQAAEDLDAGSFDDEDDFDIGDEEPDPSSPWEDNFDPGGGQSPPQTEEAKPPSETPSSGTTVGIVAPVEPDKG